MRGFFEFLKNRVFKKRSGCFSQVGESYLKTPWHFLLFSPYTHSRPPRELGGCGFGAARWRRQVNGGAARRPAGVRRSRLGRSCLLQGGALRARVRAHAGRSAAVQARARSAKQ